MLCTKCKTSEVTSNRPGTTLCYSCWYTQKVGEADDRFYPLKKAFIAAGVSSDRFEVHQTGGMLMCLAVVIDRNADTGHPQTWLYFGDPEWRSDDVPPSFSLDSERDDSELFENPKLTWDDLPGVVAWVLEVVASKGYGYP